MCSAFPKEIAGRHSPLEAGFLIPPSDLAIRIETFTFLSDSWNDA